MPLRKITNIQVNTEYILSQNTYIKEKYIILTHPSFPFKLLWNTVLSDHIFNPVYVSDI